MRRRALIIANRKSRRGADCLATAVESLRAEDFDLTIPELPPVKQLTELITAQAEHHDLMIVIGGDGSINAALPGVLASGLPLGVLPAGTANDLARTLDLPTDMAAAVAVIVAGHTRMIDVATVNQIPFLNAASLGLTIRITQQLDRKTKRRWGVLAYFIACVRAVISMRRFGAEVTADDGPPVTLRSVQMVVGNGRYFGGGMTVDKESSIDDGVLHLYSIHAGPWWSLLTLLPALRRGTHAKSPRVFNVTGKRLSVRTKRPKRISADGEIVAHAPAEFVVKPGAIRVFAPATD